MTTVEVQSVWHDIYAAAETRGQRRDVVYLLLRAPAQKRSRKSDGPELRRTNITTIFPRIKKPAKEGVLLCTVESKSTSARSINTEHNFLIPCMHTTNAKQVNNFSIGHTIVLFSQATASRDWIHSST